MTLERCEVDLERCFGYGMAYVALSRAKTLEGLQIRGWNPRKIMVDPKINRFYEDIRQQAGKRGAILNGNRLF